MSDLLALHRRLRRALVLSPSLLLLACTAGERGKSTKANDGAAQQDDDDDDAPSTAIDPDEPPPELPSCPSGEWCGPQALVEALRQPKEQLGTDTSDYEDCPAAIVGLDEVDPETAAKYDGMPVHGGMMAKVDAEATRAKRAAGEADACCYDWFVLCGGGRPLLDADRRPVLAGVREIPSRATQTPPGLTEALCRLLAEGWLIDARTEHASIASFIRARAELEAVDAPPDLLDACERAADDERRHAARCFELAARYGRAFRPTGLPRLAPRGGDLIEVAVDTFIEGCVGETIAAASAHRAARVCRDPWVTKVLTMIIDDESEHAALAWRSLAWAVASGGRPVVQAVRTAADQLRPDETPEPEPEPLAAELAANGRLDRRARAQVRAAAWATIIDPLIAELG